MPYFYNVESNKIYGGTDKISPNDRLATASEIEGYEQLIIKETRTVELKREIESLELEQARPLRELALGMEGARERLEAIEAQIEILRTELAGLQ